jgi:DNA-binding MarR family transcriptional regulator
VPGPISENQSSDASITRSDQRALQTLLWALKPLANLQRPMPLPFMTAFLMVALDEGQGVNAYARAAGIHRAAMSRNLHAIGDRARNGGPGLGLVIMQPHPSDPVRSRIVLTRKGRLVAKDIIRHLRKAT